MFAYLKGRIVSKNKNKVIIDVCGIGYEIFISLQTYTDLPEINNDYKINIYPYYRQDIQKIFGFSKEEEKSFFHIILSVNGIGSKVALAVLSTFSVSQLKKILLLENHTSLTQVPGVGKKGAQRLYLELKDKCSSLPSTNQTKLNTSFDSFEKDIVLSLISLGYSEKEAYKSFTHVQKNWNLSTHWEFEKVLKTCLNNMLI